MQLSRNTAFKKFVWKSVLTRDPGEETVRVESPQIVCCCYLIKLNALAPHSSNHVLRSLNQILWSFWQGNTLKVLLRWCGQLHCIFGIYVNIFKTLIFLCDHLLSPVTSILVWEWHWPNYVQKQQIQLPRGCIYKPYHFCWFCILHQWKVVNQYSGFYLLL